MRILGKDMGYDEPLWYFGAWEFGLFDQGWVISYRRVIRFQGSWPKARKSLFVTRNSEQSEIADPVKPLMKSKNGRRRKSNLLYWLFRWRKP